MPAQVKQDESGQLWVRKDAQSCWVKAQRTFQNGELIVHLPPEKVLPDGSIVIEAMPDESGYNGWTNYETWAVNLHLSNDQYTYNQARRYYKTADELKEWLTNCWYGLKDEIGEADKFYISPAILGLLSDLLIASLQSVNWYEIYDGLHSEDELEDDQSA